MTDVILHDQITNSTPNIVRIAIFGAGPAGFYSAEEVLKHTSHSIQIDLFDRLPNPYGFVRGGVAPDHPKIKSIIKQYERIAKHPGLRFFGSVTFGIDLTLDEALAHYHQVLFTTGAESDRHMDIPGTDNLLENHERNSPLLRQCSLRCEKTHNVITFRNRRTSRPLVLIFIVCLSFFHSPLVAHAWGTRAHRIVAHIATAYLSSHTQHEVALLLNSRSLASIADDADHWRKTRPETSRWHYVNIPFAALAYDSRRDCPDGDCLIAAIAKYREIVADRSYQEKFRQEALAFLVHLIADVHQPLHCINNNDRGGNDVTVMFFNAPTNLHAVWDNELLFRTRLSERGYTHRLMTRLASRDIGVLQRGTPIDWALAAHEQARAHAYRLPPDRNLQSRYYSDNLPILEEQLAKAGVRLASVLNEAFRRDDEHQ